MRRQIERAQHHPKLRTLLPSPNLRKPPEEPSHRAPLQKSPTAPCSRSSWSKQRLAPLPPWRSRAKVPLKKKATHHGAQGGSAVPASKHFTPGHGEKFLEQGINSDGPNLSVEGITLELCKVRPQFHEHQVHPCSEASPFPYVPSIGRSCLHHSRDQFGLQPRSHRRI